MTINTFGRVLYAIRKDCGLTQKDVAVKLGIGRTDVSKLETGERSPQPDELRALADVLQLTTLEKREFFALGIEQDDAKLLYEFANAKKQYNDLTKKIGVIQNPAYIVDAIGDIIAANSTMFKLFPFSPDLLSEIQRSEGSFDRSLVRYLSKGSFDRNLVRYLSKSPSDRNLMRYLFDSNFGFKERLGDDQWKRIVKRNILFLRAISLRHRGDEDFKKLYKDLNSLGIYTGFKEYWTHWEKPTDEETSENPDLAGLSNHYVFTYEGELLDFYTEASATITNCGGLYLIVYIAANAKTAKLFIDLSLNNRTIEIFENYNTWHKKRAHISPSSAS